MKSYPFDSNYPGSLDDAIEILECKRDGIKDKKPASMGKKEALSMAITVLKDLQKNTKKL